MMQISIPQADGIAWPFLDPFAQNKRSLEPTRDPSHQATRMYAMCTAICVSHAAYLQEGAASSDKRTAIARQGTQEFAFSSFWAGVHHLDTAIFQARATLPREAILY